MKIKITDFAKRHFDPKFGATKILDVSIEEFEEIINSDYIIMRLKSVEICNSYGDARYYDDLRGKFEGLICVHRGYADFCRLIAIPNFTDARVGSLPIALENYQYIRSGYSARAEKELPIFSRWLELPVSKPKAEYLMLVLYSKEQIDKEAEGFSEFDAEWGVVAILGQHSYTEEPMKPETMIRNALGISEGGSGVPLDREKYLASVDFWSKNITVK